MGDNMVLTDGTRSVELYQIIGNAHHDGIVMAYLRKEKLLIEADVFTPGPAGAEPPKVPNPFSVNLEANVRRLNIDVDSHRADSWPHRAVQRVARRHRQEAGAGEEVGKLQLE